jgi:hypothetical protein
MMRLLILALALAAFSLCSCMVAPPEHDRWPQGEEEIQQQALDARDFNKRE